MLSPRPHPRRLSPGHAAAEHLLLWLPVVGLAGIGCLVAAAALGVGFIPDLGAVLPVDAEPNGGWLAAFAAAGLLATAIGLQRRKRLAWWLAVCALSAAAVAQALVLEHPVAAFVAGLLTVLLIIGRHRYVVGSDARARALVVAVVAAVAIASIAEVALVVVVSGDWPGPLALIGQVTASAAAALGVGDDASTEIFGAAGAATLVASLVVLARLPVFLVALGVLRAVPTPEESPDRKASAKAILRRSGSGALLPFQTGDDKSIFLSQDASGLLVFGRAGRFIVILGDPIGELMAATETLREFVAATARWDCLIGVYQASATARGLLAEAGFTRIFPIGREAKVLLGDFDLTGAARANLRHTVTRFRRDGSGVRFFPTGLGGEAADSPTVGELASIDRTWRRRTGPQLGFTIGQFDPEAVLRQPVAVAFAPDGRIAAFATFRSTGTDGGYVLDLMRRARGSVPGALEACIVEAGTAMKARGVPYVSLGLAPLTGPRSHHPLLEERLLRLATSLGSRWYDASGLAFFKGKFDPLWEPRYAATIRLRDGLALACGLLWLHLRGGRAASSPAEDPPW